MQIGIGISIVASDSVADEDALVDNIELETGDNMLTETDDFIILE